MENTVKVFAVLVAFMISMSVNAQVKEVEVYNTTQEKEYNRVKVVYHTKDSDYSILKNKFELTSSNQSIYLSAENMKVLASELTRVYKKGVEWMAVADANGIEELDKSKESTSLITNGGMIYDSRTFKSASPTPATFGFERFSSENKTYDTKARAFVVNSVDKYNYISISVLQESSTKVYWAYFKLTFEITRDELALKDFINFLNNAVQESEKIASADKMNLFK